MLFYLFKPLWYLAFLLTGPAPDDLAICAMFKNEAPWLKEWILYHHQTLKVGHFYLYNNDSTDDYREVLQPFIDQGIVELIDWSSHDPSHAETGAFMNAPWVTYQIGAYNECLKKRALGKFKWVAMIDIDEFIVPKKGVSSFYWLLRKAEKKNKGSVSIQWRVFGTSDVYDLGPDELLTEKCIMRSQDGFAWNRLCKSIHRPEAVEKCLVHVADELKDGYSFRNFEPEKVQINHYWARTEKHCLEKRQRPKSDSMLAELNQVKDDSILKFLRPIKNELSTFNQKSR